MLWAEAVCDTQYRPHGGRGHALYPALFRQHGLRAVAVCAYDGFAHGAHGRA